MMITYASPILRRSELISVPRPGLTDNTSFHAIVCKYPPSGALIATIARSRFSRTA